MEVGGERGISLVTMTHRVVLEVSGVLYLPPVLCPFPHIADDVLQAKLVLLWECCHLKHTRQAS